MLSPHIHSEWSEFGQFLSIAAHTHTHAHEITNVTFDTENKNQKLSSFQKRKREYIEMNWHTRRQFKIMRLVTATAQLGMEQLARAFSHFYMHRARQLCVGCCARRREHNKLQSRAVCMCVWISQYCIGRPSSCMFDVLSVKH